MGNRAIGGDSGAIMGANGSLGGGGLGGNTTYPSQNGGGLFANNAESGSGGFGGGGAYIGTTYYDSGFGDTGGFGGGGGYGANGGGGSGGFGGANGGNGSAGIGGGIGGNEFGGGGAGLGGGLFVQNGGAVIVTGTSTIAGNTVTAGDGIDGGDGAAAGADIFMMSGSSVTLAPGTGNTVTIGSVADNASGNDVADDSVYSLPGNNGQYAAGNAVTSASPGGILNIGSSTYSGGTVFLYGVNTYAGGTVITNGTTLEVSQDSNLGAYSSTNSLVGNVTLAGGSELLTNPTLNGTNDTAFTTSRNIIITDTGTLAAVTGTTGTYNGVISDGTNGPGVLTIGDSTGNDNGTVILADTNTYSGGTIISAGTTLQLGDGGASSGTLGTGQVTNNTALVFDEGVATTIGNTITGTGTVTQDGPGTVMLTGNSTYTGDTIISAGTLQLGDGGASSGTLSTSQVTDNSALVFDEGVATTIGNTITGTGTVTQDGPGTVTLTGSNTYTGGTTISSGILVATNAAVLPDYNTSNMIVIDGGGTLVVQTAGGSDLGWNAANITGLLGNATFDNGSVLGIDTTNGNFTYCGSISGSLDLTKLGANTLILTGASTYSGGTTITSGILEISSECNIGGYNAGGITLNGGELLTSATTSLEEEVTLDPCATDTLAAATGTTVTYNGVLSGTGTLTVGDTTNTGTVYLTAANTYSGGTTLTNGVDLVAESLGTGAVTIDSGANLLLLNVAANAVTVRCDGSALVQTSGASTYSGGTLAVSGVMQAYGDYTNSNADTINLANSTTAITGTGSLTNEGTISGQGTVAVGIDNFSTISADGGPGQILNLSGSVTNEEGATLSADNGGLLNVADLSCDNNGAVSAATGGTVQLTGSGTITNNGAISLSGGTVTTWNALANAGTISGHGQITTGGLTTSGTVDFSGGTTTVNGGFTQTGGTVATSGTTFFADAVTVSGGTFTTYAANTYFGGGLTVNGGTFNNDPGTVEVTDLMVAPGGVVTGGAGSLYQVSGNVSNSGTGVQLSAGGLELVAGASNAHTFTWTANSGFTDIGTLTIDSGQTVDFENGGASTAALDVSSFQLTAALGASNSAAVQKDINSALSGDLNIYYNPDNIANAYLDDASYSLSGGGSLDPLAVPEPGTWAMLLTGLAFLGLIVRSRRRLRL